MLLFPLLWEVGHRGSCCDLRRSIYLPMLSSRSFIVCGLTLRSLIHFEFIFVCGVRKCSRFILLQVVDQFSQHHLLERLYFLHCIFLTSLLKIRCPSVQFSRSVVSHFLPPHESQHARLPGSSSTPRVYSNLCPSRR